ncbi:hypothetical protein [Streptococcus halotolerans]|uniref:hypothetical protein n=1 Tax=Streptococcus halotolerans TaxID=1814128 RepID=UPI0007895DA8|nr:hypothetical protein [Streptococcus halotolerans]
MIKKIATNPVLRLITFCILSLIPLLPFISKGVFHMDWDAWFHFSRIYEIAQNIQHGKLIPDVSYFSFNNHGYAVNFFYPYFVNYPIALLWMITGKPVTAVFIFNILFHLLGLEIAYKTFYKLRKDDITSFIFSIIYIFGMSSFNVRLLNMGTYNQQIAFLFLPVAIISIYEMIAGDYKKWGKSVVTSVSIITLTHLLTTYLLVIYTLLLLLFTSLFKYKTFNLKRTFNWLISTIIISLLTLLFIVPLIEQKKANDWLDVPAMNLGSNGIISNSASKVTLFSRLTAALNFEDIIIFVFIVVLIFAVYNRLIDSQSKILLWGIAGVAILQSNLIPYYYIEKFSFIDMIQFLNRFDIFFYTFIALFIAIIFQNTSIHHTIDHKKLVMLTLCLYLLFCSQNFNKEKNILSGDISEFDKISYFGTNDNVLKGLSNSNFGYFDADAGKGYYRINGFMDYRTKQQIKRIPSPNEKHKFNIDSSSYKIKNKDSYAPIINFGADYLVSTNDLIENAVYFDGSRSFKKFNQKNLKFIVKDIPRDTKIVRTPITYLKGFKVEDTKGNNLVSYKDQDGWLAIKKPNDSKVIITYEKTLLHKMSIIISGATWLVLLIANLKLKRKSIYKRTQRD